MNKLWIKTDWATGQVDVGFNDVIRVAPPIWRKFVGQHIRRLVEWLAGVSREVEILPL
jgi:hypothetical protein